MPPPISFISLIVRAQIAAMGVHLMVLFVHGAASEEFDLLKARYGKIHTIAGRGALDSNGGNDWRDEYEGGPAREAELSEAHNAQADVFGNVYIVDKDSHAVRKVRPDGTIIRVAGTNVAGDGEDTTRPGTECALSGPNGLYVQLDGTCFIFDTGNRKIRRLSPQGEISTVFHDPTLSFVGRGLWANEAGTRIYYASGAEVREWTLDGGVKVIASGFSGALANLTVDPQGRVVVTDRSAHSVFRIETSGEVTRIAGNGTNSGGGDGSPAVETGLEEARGVAFFPDGSFLVCTHRGSDLWFVDTEGIVHLFINGVRNSNPRAGEGTVASDVGVKLSEVRAVNITPAGDIILTQSDESNVRIVENLAPVSVESAAILLPGGLDGPRLQWPPSSEASVLEMTGTLLSEPWGVATIVGASSTGRNWTDPDWPHAERRFFRVRPAVRWPAP